MGNRRQILAAALAGWIGTAARAGRELMVYGDYRYPPLMHQDERGQAGGLLVEMLQRAEGLTGDHYRLELMAWKRAMSMAERGSGGLLGVSYTQARAVWLDYSQPMYEDNILIVVRRGQAFPYQEVTDLRGKTVGIGNGVSLGEAFEQASTRGLFKTERDWGAEKRLRMLLAGRLDVALIGSGQQGFEAVLRRDPELVARRSEFEVLPVPAARDPVHLAFPKSLQALDVLARFNGVLAQL